ncbi:uncharacterized protein EI90DRAFT_3018216 [Cantharellus anzutake]|uniref:uncharacterized protein n=1 Tax=Cantharellus anzutake TaxID=1750568 RepID=UPI0019069052|nr:uncharacterized protein EI90DRAFT_3021069 [Cantharellus anzutake]XP_038913590.1 uncharacterized protein EI90DRAFT_3018216 [Cantharellus anzutake]KAF8318353.1 hypothetical protein EI90DRAFT_3021069 [Cantharellus anzutake]KAF8327482.1 hypothetical protein EI90DRAFT_3018216 [Cantharellus anzutake]
MRHGFGLLGFLLSIFLLLKVSENYDESAEVGSKLILISSAGAERTGGEKRKKERTTPNRGRMGDSVTLCLRQDTRKVYASDLDERPVGSRADPRKTTPEPRANRILLF